MSFPQICEITAANNLRIGEKRHILTKHFLHTQKFQQTASVRLHLFSCLVSGICVLCTREIFSTGPITKSFSMRKKAFKDTIGPCMGIIGARLVSKIILNEKICFSASIGLFLWKIRSKYEGLNCLWQNQLSNYISSTLIREELIPKFYVQLYKSWSIISSTQNYLSTTILVFF